MSRKKVPTPCAECKDKLTTTKYCKECKIIVHRRQNKERIKAERERRHTLKAERAVSEKTGKVLIDKKYLVRGNISIGSRDCALTQEA